MSRQVEMNPGEMFLVADRTILVDERESVLAAVSKIGTTDNDRIAYFFTFTGRVNNTDETDTVTVALSPEDANELVADILHGLELLIRAQTGETED